MHAPITHGIIATVALVALPLGLVYAQAPAPATVCVVALAERLECFREPLPSILDDTTMPRPRSYQFRGDGPVVPHRPR
jgi:hypothetical protein